MNGKIIRVFAASAVSLLVAFIFIKVGVMLQVPNLEKIWGIPVGISIAYIVYADIRILREKKEQSEVILE